MFGGYKMKMVKSLLLGAAAGFVAMAGAQAADLPVKAKPVQYVKICSLYGAGYYYMPGTDTCLKIGGWARLQTGYGYRGDMTSGPLRAAVTWDRDTRAFDWRHRGYITADARSQTEFGTLRSYMAVGYLSHAQNDLGANTATSGGTGATANINRAFIQLGGFTLGLAQSFYDYVGLAAVSYNGGIINNTGDTGDPGWTVWAYTAQFGNGFSATIAAEAPRTTAVFGAVPGTLYTSLTAAALPPSRNIGTRVPDLVANLRIDQAWGGAQIMGALHDTAASYYTAASSNHPSDEIGYAIGAGLRLNAPMIGAKDYFWIQANYSEGAYNYVGARNAHYGPRWSRTATGGYSSGAYGIISDAVFNSTGGDMELTTAWGVFGSFEHNWNPKWKTSIYGTYVDVSYSATANLLLCGTAANVTAGCNNDFSAWSLGSRTAWAPVPNLEVGLDVVYQQLNSASVGFVPVAGLVVDDKDAWMAHLRVQRNFYP
jgi:hypothetical protein